MAQGKSELKSRPVSVVINEFHPVFRYTGGNISVEQKLRVPGKLKVHKRENFLGSDIEICTFS